MCHLDTAFMTSPFYGHQPTFGILFGGKYDLGIFLVTKSAAVRLFHQYQIKLMI